MITRGAQLVALLVAGMIAGSAAVPEAPPPAPAPRPERGRRPPALPRDPRPQPRYDADAAVRYRAERLAAKRRSRALGHGSAWTGGAL